MKGIGWLALALLGILIWPRRAAALPPPTGGGTTMPAGSIGSVDAEQDTNRSGPNNPLLAVMASHLVIKTAGQSAQVTVQWVAATKNAQGQGIDWNYAFAWRWRQAATGAVRLGGFFRIGSRPNGSYGFTIPVQIGPDWAAGDWDVEIVLYADTSSSAGLPNGDATAEAAGLQISSAAHPLALRIGEIVPVPVPVAVAGFGVGQFVDGYSPDRNAYTMRVVGVQKVTESNPMNDLYFLEVAVSNTQVGSDIWHRLYLEPSSFLIKSPWPWTDVRPP